MNQRPFKSRPRPASLATRPFTSGRPGEDLAARPFTALAARP
ncbi:hypothetical protein ACIRQF_31535 [Streptomyces sp. NPDC101191]